MGNKPLNIIRDARGKIADNAVDKEFDNVTKQIEEVINNNSVVTTKIFYTSATSGGTVNVKNTVKINQFGKIISWDQEI